MYTFRTSFIRRTSAYRIFTKGRYENIIFPESFDVSSKYFSEMGEKGEREREGERERFMRTEISRSKFASIFHDNEYLDKKKNLIKHLKQSVWGEIWGKD